MLADAPPARRERAALAEGLASHTPDDPRAGLSPLNSHRHSTARAAHSPLPPLWFSPAAQQLTPRLSCRLLPWKITDSVIGGQLKPLVRPPTGDAMNAHCLTASLSGGSNARAKRRASNFKDKIQAGAASA